jgi:hypothetical protein
MMFHGFTVKHPGETCQLHSCCFCAMCRLVARQAGVGWIRDITASRMNGRPWRATPNYAFAESAVRVRSCVWSRSTGLLLSNAGALECFSLVV